MKNYVFTAVAAAFLLLFLSHLILFHVRECIAMSNEYLILIAPARLHYNYNSFADSIKNDSKFEVSLAQQQPATNNNINTTFHLTRQLIFLLIYSSPHTNQKWSLFLFLRSSRSLKKSGVLKLKIPIVFSEEISWRNLFYNRKSIKKKKWKKITIFNKRL